MADIKGILQQLRDESGARAILTVTWPSGEPMGTLEILGPNSEAYIAARDRIAHAALRRRSGQASGQAMTLVEVMQARVDLAASVVVGWNGWELHGAPAQFSAEAVRELLAVEFVLDQLENGIKNHAYLRNGHS